MQVVIITSKNDVYGLRAGDFNHDGIVIVTDFNYYKTFLSEISQYSDGDTNCDGHVTVTDYNVFRLTISTIGNNLIRY